MADKVDQNNNEAKIVETKDLEEILSALRDSRAETDAKLKRIDRTRKVSEETLSFVVSI